MNARLKTLCIQRGYDPERIQALIDLHEGDEQFVEQLVASRMKSHDDAHLMPVSYKADDAGALDPLDQAYVQLRAALDADDQAGVQQALAQLATLSGGGAAPAEVKGHTLTDQGASTLPATKAYNVRTDPWAIALQADQVRR